MCKIFAHVCNLRSKLVQTDLFPHLGVNLGPTNLFPHLGGKLKPQICSPSEGNVRTLGSFSLSWSKVIEQFGSNICIIGWPLFSAVATARGSPSRHVLPGKGTHEMCCYEKFLFFVSAVLLSTFILLCLRSFSVSLSSFNLVVPMRKRLGK